MFNLAKTVVCGVAKGVIGFLAVVGGSVTTLILLDDNYGKDLTKITKKAVDRAYE